MSEEQAIFGRDDIVMNSRSSGPRVCCDMMQLYFIMRSRKKNRNNNISEGHRHSLYPEIRFCPFCGESLEKIDKIYSDCFRDDMVDMIYIKFP